MPKLVGLNEKYKEKGLVLVFVGYEGKAKLEPYAQSYKITWPIALEPTKKAQKAYGVRGYPTSFVIAPDGKVVWQGHPASKELEEIIKKLLPKVKQGGSAAGGGATKLELKEGICERLQLAVRKASRGDLGGALRLAETVLNDAGAKENEKEDAEYIKKEVNKLKADLFDEVDRLLKENLPYEARGLLVRIRRAFAGEDDAKQAQVRIDAIDADEKLKNALLAGELFAKAAGHEAKGRTTNARKYYEQIIKNYPDTEYAQKAKERLEKTG